MNKQYPFIFTNHKRHPKYEEKNFGHLASEVIVVELSTSSIEYYSLYTLQGLQKVSNSSSSNGYLSCVLIPRICDIPLISKEMTLLMLSRTYSIHLSDAFS